MKRVTFDTDELDGIGTAAFHNCTSLEEITLPKGMTHLGDAVFYGCKSLKTVTMPMEMETIGACAFMDCQSLESVHFPCGVEIEEDAFKGCTRLVSVCLEGPAGSTSIQVNKNGTISIV